MLPHSNKDFTNLKKYMFSYKPSSANVGTVFKFELKKIK